MSWWITEYRQNWAPIARPERWGRPGLYGAYIWATSRSQAKDFAELRGIGERVAGERQRQTAPYERASTILRKRKMSARKYELLVLHSLCFLGMLALASGAATIQDVLGDKGFIHDYCHRQSRRRDLIARVEEIERLVPGYWPRRKRGKVTTMSRTLKRKAYR